MLEKVQKNYLKQIFLRSRNYNFDQEIPNYEELLKTYDYELEPLKYRRTKIKLILFHNILLGNLNLKHNNSYLIREKRTRGNILHLYAQPRFEVIPSLCEPQTSTKKFR
jgi:hypothetical protein